MGTWKEKKPKQRTVYGRRTGYPSVFRWMLWDTKAAETIQN